MEDEENADIVAELESLLESTNIPDGEDKDKFKESVRIILLFIRSRPSEEDCRYFEEEGKKFVDVIRATFTIADVALKIAEFVLPCGLVTTACNIALKICNLIFGRKVITRTLEGFQTILDHEIIGIARARLHEFKTRLVFIQGLVNDVSSATNQVEKDQMLGNVASEESVMAGLKDIALVETKIEDILAEGDTGQISKLMTQVELYCCLITLHEILLHYRRAILASHNRSTRRLENILQRHRKCYENILSFLYKPTRQNVKFYLAFNEKNWPLTFAFLEQRGLQCVMHRKLCNLLDSQVYAITSARYKGVRLSLHDLTILTCARCDSKGDSQNSLLEIQRGRNNNFEIKGNELFVSDGLWVKGSKESSSATEWRIVRVESDRTEDDPSYLFILAPSKNNKCMRVDTTGRVYTTAYKAGDEKMFWKIERRDWEACFRQWFKKHFHPFDEMSVLANSVLLKVLTELRKYDSCRRIRAKSD